MTLALGVLAPCVGLAVDWEEPVNGETSGDCDGCQFYNWQTMGFDVSAAGDSDGDEIIIDASMQDATLVNGNCKEKEGACEDKRCQVQFDVIVKFNDPDPGDMEENEYSKEHGSPDGWNQYSVDRYQPSPEGPDEDGYYTEEVHLILPVPCTGDPYDIVFGLGFDSAGNGSNEDMATITVNGVTCTVCEETS